MPSATVAVPLSDCWRIVIAGVPPAVESLATTSKADVMFEAAATVSSTAAGAPRTVSVFVNGASSATFVVESIWPPSSLPTAW